MRALWRRLVVAAAVLVVAAPTAAAGDGARVEEQIARAFQIVSDFDAPIEDRVAALEDGEELRDVLQASARFAGPEGGDELLSNGLGGIDLPPLTDPVFRDVDVTRLHDRAAEVGFGIYAGPMLVTSWSGAAVRDGDRWVVSRGTFCSVLFDWTNLHCPGAPRIADTMVFGSPGPRLSGTPTKRGAVSLAVRFADGSTAEVLVPQALADEWHARPLAAVALADGSTLDVWPLPGDVEPRQPVRRYAGANGTPVMLDAELGLVIPAGRWTITVPVHDRSEADRRQVARHLTGRTTKDGFLVLDPSGPVVLGRGSSVRHVKSTFDLDRSELPIELSRSTDDSYTLLVVTLGPCPSELQRPMSSADFVAEERCLPGVDARIAVEGQARIATVLLDEVRVRNVRRPQAEQQGAAAVA